MRVLITGGLGYLGQMLSKALHADGHSVSVLDNLLYVRGADLTTTLPGLPVQKLLIGDVRDSDLMERACEDTDVVIHLAAIVGEPACGVDLGLSESTNVGGVQIALDAARKHNADFYLASTCSIFGQSSADAMSTSPSSGPLPPYAAQKREAEHIVFASGYTRAHVLRLASLFGASGRIRTDLVINNFARRAQYKAPITVHGLGAEVRPFVSVADAAQIISALVATRAWKKSSETNVGRNGQNFTIAEIAGYFATQHGASISFGAEHRPGDSRTYKVFFNESDFPVQSKGPYEEIDALVTSNFSDWFFRDNEAALQFRLGRRKAHSLDAIGV